MMLSHFLVGFDEGVGARFRIRARELAGAIRRGFQRLESALENPVEGTILTVCREAAAGAERAADAGDDVKGVLQRSLAHAEDALAHTPDLLADLKRAGVVDAGGMGFVRMIEGIVRLIEGKATQEAEEDRKAWEGSAPAATFEVAQDRDYRWCTEVLVRGDGLPSSNAARERLHELQGGSLLVIRTGDLLRVHVHLNDPEPLFELAATWGEVMTRKAEDMREQHRMLADATRAVAVVSDTACDLPDDILDQHGIALVPLQVMVGERTSLDRLEMTADAVYELMRTGEFPTTSQPTVAKFVECFEHARAGADSVVAVLLSSGLSGTYGNAEAALKAKPVDGVRLVDSRSASLGQGLLAVRAAELAEAGWEPDEIKQELERLRVQSGMFFTVATLDNLIRSGRVSRLKGWLGNLLDMKPILTLNAEGKVTPVDRVRGRAALLPRVLHLLDDALPRQRLRLRMGVVHADNEGLARRVRDALHKRYHPVDIIVSPVTAVIGVHTGPDAWGVFWQVEDGIPDRPGNKTGA
jgi:hypothetical protein